MPGWGRCLLCKSRICEDKDKGYVSKGQEGNGRMVTYVYGDTVSMVPPYPDLLRFRIFLQTTCSKQTKKKKKKLIQFTSPCINEVGPGSVILNSTAPLRQTKLIPALQHPTILHPLRHRDTFRIVTLQVVRCAVPYVDGFPEVVVPRVKALCKCEFVREDELARLTVETVWVLAEEARWQCRYSRFEPGLGPLLTRTYRKH
jgi:hypothetical protein